MSQGSPTSLFSKLHKLTDIGVALSTQRNHTQLLEDILVGAQELTGAEGGTFYSLASGRALRFEILKNDSLHLHLGGMSGNPVNFPEIPLYDLAGEPNERMVVSYAVLREETVNIEDVYEVDGFDFSGTRDFDSRTGYRTRSNLTVPLKNHTGEVIGILQLLNARDRRGEVGAFSIEDQRIVESLASQAAVAMTNQRLIGSLNKMLEGFIHAIAQAIDEKSPHTGDHCRRVPVIARLLAEAVSQVDEGPLAEVSFSETEMHELHIAALLHDCGKVTTPVHIMDKKTRLETVIDQITLISQRFAMAKKDTLLQHARGEISFEECEKRLDLLEEDWVFLERCNQSGTFVDDSMRERVRGIGEREWLDEERVPYTLLTESEVECLSIEKGTLTDPERKIIEAHAQQTIKLLEQLHYPDHLKGVPEIAGGHHERIDGTGYPNGLKKEQLSLQARILGIADIFEALTASGRPYKEPLTLTQAMGILKNMKEESQVDPDLYQVFVRERVWETFAREHLPANQIDI